MVFTVKDVLKPSFMFPLLYHAHHGSYKDDLPFWLGLADQVGDPILELGCGTGRVLIPLAQAGHRILGLDHDLGMLSILRDNLPSELNPQVLIFQAEMTDFSLEMRFGFILLPCNSYSTLTTEDRSSLLANAYRHLLPEGLFVVSLPNPYYLQHASIEPETDLELIFPHPIDGEPVQVSSSWERTRQQFVVRWYYDHLLPDGNVERITIQTDHNLVPAEDYLDEVRRAGFSRLTTFGDYDHSEFTDDSPHFIISCSP